MERTVPLKSWGREPGADNTNRNGSTVDGEVFKGRTPTKRLRKEKAKGTCYLAALFITGGRCVFASNLNQRRRFSE